MHFYKPTLLFLIVLMLMLANSCRKETCKIRSKHPAGLVAGKYSVLVTSHRDNPYSTFDSILGNSVITISKLSDERIKFTDNQLTGYSFELDYNEAMHDFFWGEILQYNIWYDCEKDYIRVDRGHGTSHAHTDTFWEGTNISH
jgi:hypothetical protein